MVTVRTAPSGAGEEVHTTQKAMADLAVGDKVQVVSQSGQVVFEDVWLFGYRDAEASQDLTRVWVSPAANTSTSPQALTLSGDHFLPTSPADGGADTAAWDKRVLRRARDVLPEMHVWAITDGGRPALFQVDGVTTERRTGLYKPFTASGTIVVDGVVASVHSTWFADAALDRIGLTHAVPALYQMVLWPARILYLALGPNITSLVFKNLISEASTQTWVWQTMMGTSAALALAALVRGESRLSGARRR